ncbi:hypothetical protein NHX12_002476 [Muraenolepis orangiensis]|uniref:TLC domain-containing protein n=1 Tax=Muraenolepis orangiensis TaxID=630683 RepID=A0A9Q0ID33_9TELE|nr:hypothetical protein NHX12_002476 [Muraenolepis orangiensis]
MLTRLSEFLWWDRLWLPSGLGWSDLEDHDGRVYAKPSHLYAALPCAFALLLVRYLFERDRVRLSPESSPLLDGYFCTVSRFPSQTSWSERKVEIWFRRRRNHCRAGLRKRFCEASLTFDVKRKDFKEQVIHHIATLTLLAFSWASNYIRIGTLVMVTHDSADILLERSANGMFVVFTSLFALTRLVILPFWLIHCTWVYPLELYPPFFGYYFLNAMLVVLQILHFYWAVLISKMLYKCLFSKVTQCGTALEGDDRSDEEEEDSDSPKEEHRRVNNTNICRARARVNGH